MFSLHKQIVTITKYRVDQIYVFLFNTIFFKYYHSCVIVLIVFMDLEYFTIQKSLKLFIIFWKKIFKSDFT